MAYCSQTDIETHSGYGYTDFLKNGAVMSSSDWASYVTTLIAGASAEINRFCRVPGFESTQYTEYHNGRGSTGTDRKPFPYTPSQYSVYSPYREIDRTFLPRNQPVISVTSVHVDTTPGSTPTWTLRNPRTDSVYGDYSVNSNGYVTRIRFHMNVPGYGFNNVKIIYTAGYAPGSQELAAIKLICMDIVRNFLAMKKREQEAVVASFESGTQTIAQMISLLHPEVFTDEIKMRLAPFRRSPRGEAWH